MKLGKNRFNITKYALKFKLKLNTLHEIREK
jgi:hypothetical protein